MCAQPTTAASPIRVVVVDDSVLIRTMLRSALEAESDIVVAGSAGEPYEAREVIKSTNPDVVTLDVEMPNMNGLEFLEKIMTLRPMPVVMVSSLTSNGAEATLNALETGAVDFIAKPAGGSFANDFADAIRRKVRAASRAQVRRIAPPQRPQAQSAPRRERRAADRHRRVDRRRGGDRLDGRALAEGIAADCRDYPHAGEVYGAVR